MNKFCIECGKEIKGFGKRCNSCENKRRHKLGILNPHLTSYKDGRSLKKYFCCICSHQISVTGGLHGGRCQSCEMKRRIKEGIINSKGNKNGMFGIIGKNHLNWKGGKPNCIDCGKILSNYNSIRCIKCSNKGKNNPHYGKINHGKWTEYKGIWFRSSWEEAFVKWCDKNHIAWLYEPKTFDLGNITYTPDFYLPEFHLYIEVKGWWRDDAKAKFELFKQKYCGERIKVVDKQELIEGKVIK